MLTSLSKIHEHCDYLGGVPKEILYYCVEGMDMTVHEGLKGPLFDELDVHGACIAEDHGEGIDGMDGSTGLLNLEVSPFDLSLEGGLRFEPDVGDPGLLILDGPDRIYEGHDLNDTLRAVNLPGGSNVPSASSARSSTRPTGAETRRSPHRKSVDGKIKGYQKWR